MTQSQNEAASTKQLPARILIVDDEEGMREFLSICLGRVGYRVVTASSGADALNRLSSAEEFDLVLTDLTMPGIDGMEVLRHACALPFPPVVIMMTAFATTDTAIQAIKAGAFDYLTKPFKVDEIRVVVGRALEGRALRAENKRLREQLRGAHHLDRMIGRSSVIRRVFDSVQKVAPTRANVLIRGESGTGKELVARALHNLSDRASGPFLGVNCAAIPESLLESELFGHKRGAFTGASHDRTGVFEAAQGGTLFLDEIGELDLNTQVKLLRTLQERKIRPVGGTHEVDVDCRVVAATNRDLEAAIEAGEFRQDLYFRLNVIQLVLPPLRHRKEDIPLLLERFFDQYRQEIGRPLSGISPEALDRFLAYDYPGNIRELENLVERAIALETGTQLSADHLPELKVKPAELQSAHEIPEEGIDLDATMADLERKLIESALRRTGGVRKDAAKLLRVSFRSLRYRLQKLGIEIGRSGASESDRDPS